MANNKQTIEIIEEERGRPLTNEQKSLLNQKWVKENQTFLQEQILEFYDLYQLYADYRTKKIDLKDILSTANTLGLNKKYALVFRVLQEIQQAHHKETEDQNLPTDNFDFQTFVETLTEKLGNIYSVEGRQAIFELIDVEQKGEVDKEDLQKTANELRYTLQENEAEEIIQNVAGFGQENFDFQRFDKFVARKVERKKDRQ